MNTFDDYHQTNFAEIVEKRKDGITEKTFMEDVHLYQEAINSLPAYKEEVFRYEIRQMNFDIPADEYDFRKLQIIYSRLVAYRFRIVEMFSIINAHHDMFEKAYKSLRSAAIKLTDGTAKDKEAYAENRVQPFAIGVMNTDSFLKYIAEIKEAVEFASTNMARMLREREALANINTRYNFSGSVAEFERVNTSQETTPSTDKIDTKYTIIDTRDEDGIQVRKKIGS